MRRRYFKPMGIIALAWTAGSAQAGALLSYMQEDDNGKRIIIADSDGTNARALTSDGQWSIYPDLSADGRLIAYSRGSGDSQLEIVVQNVPASEAMQIAKPKTIEHWTAADGRYLHADFSGDGRFLAFSGPVGPNKSQRIGIIDLAKERARGPSKSSTTKNGLELYYTPELKVIDGEYSTFFPTLSSTGEFVIFERSKGMTKDLVRYDVMTGKTTSITPEDGYAMAPALSFDDRYLAYTAKVNNEWDIYVKDLTTNETVQITKTPFHDYAPNFRADGGLVFAANPDGPFALFQISAASMRDRSFTVTALPKSEGTLYAPSVSGETTPKQGLLGQMPEPSRSSFGAISHNGKIYAAGGHQGHEHTYPPESFSDRLNIYDPFTNRWREGARLSLPRHGFSLAAYENYIYAFGGFTYSAEHKPRWRSTDIIERYDIAQNRWEVVGHLAKPRSSNVVAQVGSKVYLIGGWDGTPQHDNDFEGRFHDTIEVFDLTSETISTLPTLIKQPLRRALSAVVVGEEIILVGGLGVGASHFSLLDQLTAFNTRTQTWRDLPPLPFATFAPAAGVLDGKIYVFGGMFKTGEQDYNYVNHIYSFDLATNVWQHTGRYLSEPKGFGQVISLGPNQLGILGGHEYEGQEDHPVLTFETFGK